MGEANGQKCYPQTMRGTILLAVLLLVWAGLQPFHAPSPPLTPHTNFKMGVHLLVLGKHTHFPRDGWGEHLRYARQMTGENGWVVQLVYQNDLNPVKWQQFLEDCEQLQLRPVLRLATQETPDHWAAPPQDKNGGYAGIADAWTTFFEQLALKNPIWVVVGNEPNNGGEWGGTANPTDYARYFVAVASRLKTLQKPIWIAPAALDLYLPHTNGLPFPGTQTTMMDAAAFWDGMFATEPHLMDLVDFWASHVYPLGAFHRPPQEQAFQVDRFQGAEQLPIIHPPYGIYNRGINSYRWEKWYLENVIGVKIPPILITEFGYRHRESVQLDAVDSGGAEVDSRTAADYAVAAIFGNNHAWGWIPPAHDPDVIGIVYFALAGAPKFWGHTNLLLVDEHGQVWGTYPIYDELVQRTTH